MATLTRTRRTYTVSRPDERGERLLQITTPGECPSWYVLTDLGDCRYRFEKDRGTVYTCTYSTTEQRCTCPAGRYKPGRLCRHLDAISELTFNGEL